LSAEIQNPINGLPERCRQIFMLSRYEGKKYKEIAALLGGRLKPLKIKYLKH
jgi:DNA-directed RNA polymerase specialized sigma24 family protein